MFDLSEVDRAVGDQSGAIKALRIGLRSEPATRNRYYLPRDLTALTEIRVTQHKTQAAGQLFEQAEDILDGILVNQHSLYESTARADSMSETYLAHFNLARSHGNTARVFHVLERVRGRVSKNDAEMIRGAFIYPGFSL
jgi:hypothetical protein